MITNVIVNQSSLLVWDRRECPWVQSPPPMGIPTAVCGLPRNDIFFNLLEVTL